MNDIIFEVVDVFGNTVRLLEAQWTHHIKVRHPEITPFLSQIIDTIRAPDCVFASEVEENSKIFYKRAPTRTMYENLFLKVIIKYQDVPAFVVTTYFSRSITGGKLLWIKTTL